MRILFLTHSFNSLSQRLFVELRALGHTVSVEFDINDSVSAEAVRLFQPDLIIAPFLKRAIPETIWRRYICLVVHPGIIGDRGPSALDWAILNNETRWGVTIIQANGEMDMGDIWASVEFPMRAASKSSLYRREVSDAAVAGVIHAVSVISKRACAATDGPDEIKPLPLDYTADSVRGQARPLVTQDDRRINWQRDDSATVMRKIRSADGVPGVLDSMFERELYLYDARIEKTLRGSPGAVIARCGPAVCRATRDGAVWIGHVRECGGPHPFKLPATHVLAREVQDLAAIRADEHTGYREIWYEESAGVAYLYFDFYNGAMNVDQCQRLRDAFLNARERDTKLIVLMGGADFWSNGMHLNCIEAACSAADSSWENINAIDDLAFEIMTTSTHLTVAALRANAGAGGVFLARAADLVWIDPRVIVNPHYKDMGNLYGSEYWTYLLPKCAGAERAEHVSRSRLPMGAIEACDFGLADNILETGPKGSRRAVIDQAQALLATTDLDTRLDMKRRQRQADEARKPLARYREEELNRMKLNFYGFDPSYHVARYNFVHKIAKSRTPITIAQHRDRKWSGIARQA